jgi:beta-glucosidase
MGSGVSLPRRQLRAFQRVSIPKGETKNVLLEIDKRDLSYWDEQTHAFIQVKGPIRFEIGASSADIRQTVMK